MTSNLAPERRQAFTRVDLIALVVLLFLGVGYLFANIAPLRRESDRSVSSNNLKQIVLASINFADQNNGMMPPGPANFFPGKSLEKSSAYGPCLFHILPQMDNALLYKESGCTIDGKPIHGNWLVAGKPFKPYQSPSDPTLDTSADRTSYLANELAFPSQGARFPSFYSDNPAQTIFFIEAYSRTVDTVTWGGKTSTWRTDRRWWDNPTWTPAKGRPSFQLRPAPERASSLWPQGYTVERILIGLGDGSVAFGAPSSRLAAFYNNCTPNSSDIGSFMD